MKEAMPSRAAVRREVKRLRAFIDGSDDLLATRIAYEVECALRWATEPTAGWQRPLESVLSASEIAARDIAISAKLDAIGRKE